MHQILHKDDTHYVSLYIVRVEYNLTCKIWYGVCSSAGHVVNNQKYIVLLQYINVVI